MSAALSGGREVIWRAREVPLSPVAVVGRGEVASRLVDLVIERGCSWHGVVGNGLIVVLGDDLPWVDGVLYLGRAAGQPALLHDTRLEPDVPVAWIAKRLCGRGAIAWLQSPDLLVPLGAAAPFHAPALQAWRNR